MTKLPKVSVFSLGCKVNSYDGDAMLAVLSGAGFEVSDSLEYADVYVLNTCAVTAEAEKKSRQAVTRILKINPNAEIYVCGCASQNNFSQFEKNGVKYIGGTEGKIKLAKELAVRYTDAESGNFASSADFSINNTFEDNDGVKTLKTRHFIKVQDGCNNFCSYCLIPYVRGRSRSRATESIIAELEAAGGTAKEVVLTGINLSAYGLDIDSNLTELLRSLGKFDFRVRLGSLEVNVINDEFLTSAKNMPGFCPHFHLSLQSGDDGVLKAMNRHYSTEEYMKAVNLIRRYFPNAGITTDVIVGFPTEDETAFERSMAFVEEVAFSDVHVFPYSSRKGTVAGKMKPLSSSVVEARAKKAAELKHKLVSEYLLKQRGEPLEVLYETYEDGYWCGHTPNYVKVYSEQGERNTIKTVVPTELFRDGLK